MAIPFIFDPSKGETPESIAKKRKVAEALLQGGASRPRTFGEGLAALGEGLAYRALMNQVGRAERAGIGAPPIPRPNPLGGALSGSADHAPVPIPRANPLGEPPASPIPRPSPLRRKFSAGSGRLE